MSTSDDRMARAPRQPGDRRSPSVRTGSGTTGTGAHRIDAKRASTPEPFRASQPSATPQPPWAPQPSATPQVVPQARPAADLPGFDEDPYPSLPEGLTQSIDTRAANLFDEEEKPARSWHGGADLGLVVMRLVLGGIFIAHGSQKLFGAFGGPGIDGFANFLQGLGFRDARILSWVTGGTELAGGGLVVLGLFTPLAAAGLAGVMANVVLLKWHNGLFLPKGFEYELAMACVAAGLAFTGPGRAALDNGRFWYRHPLASGFICLVLAGGATAAIFFGLRQH